jgi:hypothetical protein
MWRAVSQALRPDGGLSVCPGPAAEHDRKAPDVSDGRARWPGAYCNGAPSPCGGSASEQLRSNRKIHSVGGRAADPITLRDLRPPAQQQVLRRRPAQYPGRSRRSAAAEQEAVTDGYDTRVALM